MLTMKTKTLFFVIFLFLGLTTQAFSEDFPKRPIRIIIPYGPGGATDLVVRSFQNLLEKELKTKVVVENMPGGTTKIATYAVMKAKADGYTLLFCPNESMVSYYYAKVFDNKVWEILTPIGNITKDPSGIIEVNAKSPYKTWGDLVEAAKKRPGELTCGMIGVGGMRELYTNEIKEKTGIDFKYVPFSGAGTSNTALLGGHVDFRLVTPGEAIAMIRAGMTRGPAVSTPQRMKALPDVPTFEELGIGKSWVLTRSIWGPPNLPQNILTIITKAIEKGTKDSEFIKLLEDQFLVEAEYRTPDRIQEGMKTFDKNYGPKFVEMYK